MTEQHIQPNQDDEISLLDILVTLAESWKLLVFGPLIAGLLAGGLSFLWPNTFESVAIVRLTEQELALVNTAPVLDSVIKKLGLATSFDGVQQDAREYLAKKIVTKFDKKTGLATITASAGTPEKAQEIGMAAMDALLEELLPKGKAKEQIEQKILSIEGVIANDKDALESIKKQIRKPGLGEAGVDVVMKHYASLTADIAAKELENSDLRRRLVAKADDVYVQPPSLPSRKVSPKRSLVVLLAALAAGFSILFYVFLRKAWLSASQDEQSLEKIQLIKRAFSGK